jgi:hypothetical protein
MGILPPLSIDNATNILKRMIYSSSENRKVEHLKKETNSKYSKNTMVSTFKLFNS